MSEYSQVFTLKDIFNNPKLKGKLPLVNYKEKVDEAGKTHRRTNMRTVSAIVYDTAKSAAKPFYKPMQSTKSGNIINIGGNLVGDYETAYEAVYQAIKGSKYLLSFTANAGDMIRSALKEDEKRGTKTKLYLRAGSMLEIEGMDRKRLIGLMNNIMENLFYSDEFPLTQEKYAVDKVKVRSSYSYEVRKQKWKQRVGAE